MSDPGAHAARDEGPEAARRREFLTRLSVAGEWSLLDEIGEATGLPVPQKD